MWPESLGPASWLFSMHLNRVSPLALHITLHLFKRPLDEGRSNGTWRDGTGQGTRAGGDPRLVRSPALWPGALVSVGNWELSLGSPGTQKQRHEG